MRNPPDIERLRARDPDLLEELVGELGPRIRIAICKYVDSDDEADDVMQECWVRIMEELDRYEPRGSFAGWATAVSRNVAKIKLREKKDAETRVGPAEEEFERRRQRRVDTEDASRDGLESTDEYWKRVVLEALARLPTRERDAITLRLLRRKTTRETADALAVSEDAVHEILKRGMTRLRRMKKLRGLLPKWKGWE